MIKRSALLTSLLTVILVCSSWGFFAHQKINRFAVFTLPDGLIGFYKANINYITEHAVDADKRRYSDSLEAPRHYIDADHYGSSPFDSIPEKYKDAAEKFGEQRLQDYGTLPWQIERTYYLLVKAFEEKDGSRILRLSADIGHYIADAHVPLHTTQNYNGQLTNQIGIHGFWESRLPELFADKYDYFVGKAQYIENPLKASWKMVKDAFSYKDSVLLIEARLSRTFPSDQKFTFSERNGRVTRQYSAEYSQVYHDAMKGMVEKQMRASILAVGSFWYSAWVDAGQPRMTDIVRRESQKEKEELEDAEKRFRNGRIIGRGELE